jgi:hypothetical protein
MLWMQYDMLNEKTTGTEDVEKRSTTPSPSLKLSNVPLSTRTLLALMLIAFSCCIIGLLTSYEMNLGVD